MTTAHKRSSEDVDVDALVEMAQSGDPAANEALFRHFYPLVYSIVLCYLCEKDEILEAIQVIFEKTIRGLSTYRHSPGCFGAWLARIARNHCINIVRRRRTTISLNALEGTDQEPASYGQSPEDQVIAIEGRKCLVAAAKRLSPTRQAAFLLYHLLGFSYKEIAVRLGCKVSTVGVHLHKACELLQKDPDVQAWYAATKDRD